MPPEAEVVLLLDVLASPPAPPLPPVLLVLAPLPPLPLLLVAMPPLPLPPEPALPPEAVVVEVEGAAPEPLSLNRLFWPHAATSAADIDARKRARFMMRRSYTLAPPRGAARPHLPHLLRDALPARANRLTSVPHEVDQTA